MKRILLAMTALAGLALMPGQSLAADCDITVGLVMELTGPAGQYGQAGAKSVEMAFRDINEAGIQSIIHAHPFPPLPADMSGELVDVHVRMRTGVKVVPGDMETTIEKRPAKAQPARGAVSVWNGETAGGLSLFAYGEYVRPDDSRLAGAVWLGSYPRPLDPSGPRAVEFGLRP